MRARTPSGSSTSAPRQPAIGQRARDHRAKASDGKDAVDGQPGPPEVGAAASRAPPDGPARASSSGRPWPVSAETGTIGAPRQHGARQLLAHLFAHQVQPVWIIHEVGFGEGHDAARHLQQVQNGEVLARLRHHALVGGHHQQCHVDAADARQHVLDEILVAGHIDDADLCAAGQGQPGKAQVDGHRAACSSLRRSGLMPVSACTRVDLP